jgi:hypothetical protein
MDMYICLGILVEGKDLTNFIINFIGMSNLMRMLVLTSILQVEILKAEIAFATTVKGIFEAEGLASKTLSELGFCGLNKMPYRGNLKLKKNKLEEKMEQIVLGEALLANIELDSLKLNDAIVEVKPKKWC